MSDPDITVRVALDSDPDDPAPAWTDITDRVHYGDGGQEVTIQVGRQNETAEIQPTEMGWALRNHDNLFTPGSSTSPYAGKWEQGRRVEIAETVDGDTFDLGTGFLEIPDMPIVDPRSSQPVAVSAVDWMGRLENAPAMEGTLAEHIRAEGGGELVEWFPLTEAERPWMSTLSDVVGQADVGGFFDLPVPKEPEDLLQTAAADGPPGDDQRYALWDPAPDAQGDAYLGRAKLTFRGLAVQVGTSDVVAVSAWVRADTPTFTVDPAGGGQPSALVLTLAGATTSISILDDATGYGFFVGGGGNVQVNATRRLERDVWRLITARMDYGSGQCDLWIGSDMAATGTLASSPAADIMTTLTVGDLWLGAIGHVQVRVGDSTTMTRADHIAQHLHGYRGLHRQTVAERLVTLAGYAGVPATEVDVSAAASTPLLAARLAGVNPAAAMRQAATSGQDTLVSTGSGQITVVPRAQRYNQAVTLSIPFGWIGYRGLRYRPDKPVTDVTATRTGGGTARRIDRIKRSRYGVNGLRYDLDSDIDADPANLASWALAAHSQPRTRCPSIRLNMLKRTIAERKALLGLRVGDRIEITGLPSGSPDDVGHLIVQGIRHTIGPGRRRVIEFNTSPLLGPAAGQPPACPMVGDLVSTTAIIAY